MRGTSGDVVGHTPALTVGDVREHDERGRVRDGVLLLDRVADGVDVRVLRLVGFVDRDATARPEPEARQLGEPDLRSHADGPDDETCGQPPPVGQVDGAFVHRRDGRARLDVHTVRHELVLHENRQLGVERCQHLRGRLDDGHVDALTNEVLGHLETDEPRPDHHRGHRSHVDVRGEPGRVLHGAQRADSLVAGNRGPYRGGPHAEHELVVGDVALLARNGRAGGDLVGGAVDGHHLLMDPHVEAEAVEELLGRLQRQRVLFLDEAPDEVGQAAVGERHVTGALENDDVGVGVQATQPGRRRHPAGDASYDHDRPGRRRGCSGLRHLHHLSPSAALAADVLARRRDSLSGRTRTSS